MILPLRSLFFILLLYCYIGINTQATESGCLRSEVRRTYAGAADSFKVFVGKLRTVFGKPFMRLEKIRRRIKKAFFRFVDESKASFYEPYSRRNKIIYQKDVVPEMPMFELIVNQNFLMETHTVLTKDGYMVTIHRLLKISRPPKTTKKTILLCHGLWGSTMDWIILGAEKSLPYLLLKSGYDVWLANARGNKYSNSHVSKATNSSEYWNFSWHEIGLFDIPAIIDYLIEVTQGKSEIIVIAYSMGATALLVLLSSLPQYNTIIKSAILIAPLVYMYHVKGPIRYLANTYKEYDLSFLSHNINELIPDSVIEKFCRGSIKSCSNILLLLGSGGKEMSNENVTASILRYVPAGGSKKTLLHYIQLIRSGKFQMFDYGSANTILYGSESPTSYPLSNVNTPIVVINSLDDWLSNEKDIFNLLLHIRVVNHTVVVRNDFSHFDFLWADDAPILVYALILDYVNNN